MIKIHYAFITLLCCLANLLVAQEPIKQAVPSVYSNIQYDEKGNLVLIKDGNAYPLSNTPPKYQLSKVIGNPIGTEQGFSFDFQDDKFSGILFFGFIPYGDSKHPMPVYFGRGLEIKEGKVSINLLNTRAKHDMINWQKTGKGTLGYRIMNRDGVIVYDGKLSFRFQQNKFEKITTILEGPFVNLLNEQGATISFKTNEPIVGKIEVDGKTFADSTPTLQHEIKISGLSPDKKYEYQVIVGEITQKFHFKTAPKAGSRKPFVFSYASDSRNASGGGERNMYGANGYIMKKIMALNTQQNVAFMQFSGDLIDGYLSDIEETELQYANWKRAIEPFWHYFPMYISIGNHEALIHSFQVGKDRYEIDRFPFETESAEAIFSKNFVNPTNGLESEDGASYDPNPNRQDFPSYKETVFHYTYDNVAVIVLNSNYLYAPSDHLLPYTGGGLHAYIMDKQVEWLEKTLINLEKDKNIDHVFITEHTPFFPNGGHVDDDMWYNGNNKFRSYVAGKPLEKGIIQRRDQMLDLLVNKSKKVVAILTGDEHNYAKTELSPDTKIYLDDYKEQRIKLTRTIYQINNGAAGAPYYAQEQTPWTPKVTNFSTQHALCFFHVKGKKIRMEVLNPDTLEKIDELQLK
jgi:hypothetical protein